MHSTRFAVHYFKSANLSPDERNAMRRDAKGIWLHTGFFCDARNPRNAREQYVADCVFHLATPHAKTRAVHA